MLVNIFHTNDIHSNYDFLRKVDKYLKVNRGPNDLYLDIGDFNDIKSSIVDADKGNMAMELFMTTGLDLMAVGNNEIDLEFKGLKNIVNKFPIISANLTDASDNEIAGLNRSKIFDIAGKKILCIAVSPYYGSKLVPGKFNSFFTLGNLKTCDPLVRIREELDKHRDQSDFIILLSHTGHVVDELLMEKFPEIDLYLAAHTHIITKSDKYTMCGKGEVLGRVVLDISDSGVKINSIDHIGLVDQENIEFDKILDEKNQRANEILSVEMEAIESLDFSAFKENRLINFICDALMMEMDGDLAIMHNGISEGALEKPISRKTLLENLPSKLNPTVFPVLGKHIKEALLMSFDEEFINDPGEGAGFRGTILGSLSVSSNVEVFVNPFKVLVDGSEMEDEKVYRLLADDYLQRGQGYPSLRTPDKESSYENMYIRDLIAKYLQDEELFELSKKKRIHY